MSFAAESFAAHLARAVDLFRDPEKKEDQKRVFRALVAMLQGQSVTVRVVGGRISVNGAPIDGPQLGPLLQRLELHGVGEMTIPQDAPVSQVFALLRALADQPAWSEDIDARLRASGASHVSVSMARLTDPPSPPPSREELPPAAAPGLDVIASPAAPVAGIAAFHNSSPMPVMPAPGGSNDALEVLATLESQPHGAGVGDTLAALVRQAEEADKAGKIDHVLRIICGIVRIEQTSLEGGARRTYGIALKRMFTKSTLEALAQLTASPSYQADAIVALKRAGADGAEVLLDRLVAASSAEERRHLFSALTQIKQGAGQLAHLLGHNQWFVVRNIAELAGELAAEDAVPALAQQLEHEDERVRKAVALALAKIGSRNTAEPLRRALRDQSPEVRLQVALGVGGRRASPLAMLLTGALEEEKEAEVVRELLLALGRIGSPEAVQALIKFVQPSGKLFGRRPTSLRLAAVDALRMAGSPAAVGTLQGLAGDGDREVRAAAQAALADLKKKA